MNKQQKGELLRKHITAPAKCNFDIMGYAYVTGYKMISEGPIPVLDNPTNYDPKHITAMATITRDRSHQIIAAQTRLDRRYTVQSKTEHTGGGPFVVGWQDTPTADPMNDLPVSKEPQGGEVRR